MKEEFYLAYNHNEIWDEKNPKLYDNIGDIKKNVIAFSDFKNELFYIIFLLI